MKTQHTPGEWVIVKEKNNFDVESIDGETLIAIIVNQAGENVTQDNAKLIAAAPEMLEALNSLMEYKRIIDQWMASSRDSQAGKFESIFNKAEAAIKKATE